MTENQYKLLQDALGGGVEKEKNLFPYFTLRTQVFAGYFFEAKTRSDLIKSIQISQDLKIPHMVLGGGSNIAVLQPRIELFVIRNEYLDMRVVKDTPDSVHLSVSSGYSMGKLVQECVKNGWEGLEYHRGLPGTVGGAVFMNSKWTRPWTYVGDRVFSAVLLDSRGKEKSVTNEYFQFAYDYSRLQETGELILDVVFSLKKNKPGLLEKRAAESLEYRRLTQPSGVATAGCFFRNIPEAEKKTHNLPTNSAGYLIDASGMKGAVRGAFEVSTMHANFIINSGKSAGKPDDLLQLINEIKQSVKKKFGIELKEEVVIL